MDLPELCSRCGSKLAANASCAGCEAQPPWGDSVRTGGGLSDLWLALFADGHRVWRFSWQDRVTVKGQPANGRKVDSNRQHPNSWWNARLSS